MTEAAVVVDGVSKRFRLYSERNQSLKAAVMRGRPGQVPGVLGPAGRLVRDREGPDLRDRGRERVGEVDPAQVPGPHPATRQGLDPHHRQGRRPPRAGLGLPPRAVGAGERLPQRLDPRARQAGHHRPLRRDRGLRRRRALHRPAGEELLVGHVRAPGVLGGHPPRPRHPPGRRGAGRGRRRLPAQVLREVLRLPPRRQDGGDGQPRIGVHAHHVRPGGVDQRGPAGGRRPGGRRRRPATSTTSTPTARSSRGPPPGGARARPAWGRSSSSVPTGSRPTWSTPATT